VPDAMVAVDGRPDTVPGMRHVGTLIAAIVIAPLAWILLAYGQDRSVQAFTNAHVNGAYHAGDFVRPVQFLAAAGLLLGLLATLRFSPLGATVAGAGYVVSYGLLLVAPDGLLGLFRYDLAIAGHHANPTTPIRTGTTLLLGTLLLVGAASVGRWRRWPRRAGEALGADESDRPVGADGLGLTPPDRWTEPELAVRYSTRPRPAGSADEIW
jgi:hypothetical protein